MACVGQMKRRTAWVGELPYHATEATIGADDCLGQFGKIDSIHIVRRGSPPQENGGVDMRLSWALVSYELNQELFKEDRDAMDGEEQVYSHSVALAQSSTVRHPRAQDSAADDLVRLVVLPASRRMIGTTPSPFLLSAASCRLRLEVCGVGVGAQARGLWRRRLRSQWCGWCLRC